jgi:transcriptional regulator with XRE-family HTH domain
MNLSDYMSKAEVTDADVATALGVHRASVTRYRNGKQKPSIKVLARLSTWSNGEITVIDFVAPDNGGG